MLLKPPPFHATCFPTHHLGVRYTPSPATCKQVEKTLERRASLQHPSENNVVTAGQSPEGLPVRVKCRWRWRSSAVKLHHSCYSPSVHFVQNMHTCTSFVHDVNACFSVHRYSALEAAGIRSDKGTLTRAHALLGSWQPSSAGAAVSPVLLHAGAAHGSTSPCAQSQPQHAAQPGALPPPPVYCQACSN